MPFPTKEQCHSCVQQIDENGDAIEYNQDEVYNYFKEFYYLQNSARNSQSNDVLLFSIALINLFVFFFNKII